LLGGPAWLYSMLKANIDGTSTVSGCVKDLVTEV